LKKLFILLLITFNLLHAETEFSDPKPSMDNPRKIVFPLNTTDEDEIDHLLSVSNNVLKFYGMDNCNIVIVCYSKGIKLLIKNKAFLGKKGFKHKDIPKRVAALMMNDVEFIACNNTMKTYDINQSDLIEDIEVVTSGVSELVEKQLDGYTYVRP